MSRPARVVFGAAAAALVLTARPAGAQTGTSVRLGAMYESYGFGSGLIVDRISELTVPLVVDAAPTPALRVTLSGGFARVSLTSADASRLSDQRLSGLLDTEIRATYAVIPERLLVVATGALPTGNKSVALDELAVIGTLSSDLIGFSAPNLGTGGSIGGGFVGAAPVGRFAVGYGATYRQAMSFRPVASLPDSSLTPGAELRVRSGLEGALAQRTYLRVAAIYAVRQKDQINGASRNGIGNRLIAYASVNQGVGRAQVTFYGFDVFRGNPQIEPSAAGAAVFPRGNLLGLGLQARMGTSIVVAPRVEYRLSAIAVDTADTALRRAGSTVRLGADVRLPAGPRATFVLRGSGLFGNVVQSGSDVSVSGFRVGTSVELRP